jgi:hypothetical protein
MSVYDCKHVYISYSTLLHLPPLRFRCITGCWDRTQNCCDCGQTARSSNHSSMHNCLPVCKPVWMPSFYIDLLACFLFYLIAFFWWSVPFHPAGQDILVSLLFVPACRSAFLPAFLSNRLSVHQPACMTAVYLSISFPACLSVHPPFRPAACLHDCCLPVYLVSCLPVYPAYMYVSCILPAC